MSYYANPIPALIDLFLAFYWWVIIIAVVMSWLVAFNVINTRNNLIYQVVRTLDALTEPVFRPIRRILPDLGGLDLSPLIVLLAIGWIRASVLPWLVIRLGLY